MNQAIKYSCNSLGDAEREKIKQRPVVSFVSEAVYNSTEKEKERYIEITYMHATTKQNI